MHAMLQLGCDFSQDHRDQSDRVAKSIKSLNDKDSEAAIRLREELTEEDNVHGTYLFALINFYGVDSRLGFNKDLSSDPTRAAGLLERIPGYAMPEYLLAKILLSQGDPKVRDYKKILELLEFASEWDEGQSVLADIYLEGVVVPQDLERAEELLREQAGYGIESAQAKLVWLLANRADEKGDLIEALSWLYVLSERGHTTFSEFFFKGWPATFRLF